MCWHIKAVIRDSGQVLAEAPFVIVTLCLMIFMLLQPVAYLSSKMMLGYATANLARIKTTDMSYGSSNHGALIEALVSDKLMALPRSSLFMVPGSLEVKTDGDPSSNTITVECSIRQKPLPFLRSILSTNDQGEMTLKARTALRGAHFFADMRQAQEDLVVGAGWQE